MVRPQQEFSLIEGCLAQGQAPIEGPYETHLPLLLKIQISEPHHQSLSHTFCREAQEPAFLTTPQS